MKKIKLSENQVLAWEAQIGFRSPKVSMAPICFVGNIVMYPGGEGVVLDYNVEHTGLSELLLILDPKRDEPVVIESFEVEKIEFKNASPECQSISKAILYLKYSKKYLR